MIPSTSSTATMFKRLLTTACVLLTARGAVCVAQQSTSTDASAHTANLAAQQRPIQIVRPMEGRHERWRGVPWIGDTGQTAVSEDAVSGEVAFAPKQLRHKKDEDRNSTLRVSGWWTIDIKNPDGSTASHHEFENDFTNSNMIVYLLAGKFVPGEAAITFASAQFYNQPTPSPCSNTNACVISQLPNGYWATSSACIQNPGSCSSNLTESFVTVSIQYSPFGPNGPQDDQVPALELSGQITAQNNNPIGHVDTEWVVCSESAATNTSPVTALNPASCLTNPSGTFSIYNPTFEPFDEPINVTAGQVIQVKVDISFSRYPNEG